MWHLIVLSVALFNPHMHTAVGVDDFATVKILWSFNSRGECMTALAEMDGREVLVTKEASIRMRRACIPDTTLAAQSAAAPNEKSGIYLQLKK